MLLSTLSTIETTGEKRRRNNNNFNENLPEACDESEVLHGICALMKSPVDEKDAQRYSSSDSDRLQIHFNTEEEKEKVKKENKLCTQNYEDFSKESTSGTNFCFATLLKTALLN